MIRTVTDFQSATRCDEDGQPDESGDFILDDGQPQNIECYSDTPCPACGDGCVFGADFPNGDAHGGCLKCGASLEWDNDLGEWKQ